MKTILVLTLLLFWIGSSSSAQKPKAAPKVFTPQEAVTVGSGVEVTVAFLVKEARCNVLGMVPRGQELSFQLIPQMEQQGGAPAWVSGVAVVIRNEVHPIQSPSFS